MFLPVIDFTPRFHSIVFIIQPGEVITKGEVSAMKLSKEIKQGNVVITALRQNAMNYSGYRKTEKSDCALTSPSILVSKGLHYT